MCDHREMFADEDLHGHAAENLAQADALLFGRVTYEMMEAAWRPPAGTGARAVGLVQASRLSLTRGRRQRASEGSDDS
jgi:hypothetical protein